MQSLRARIRQLEADNASLVTAAEQAAALAEEYAADAAKYRVANNSSQTALINELTDAARRKDLRIQRLTALLEAEKKRTEDTQRRLEELVEIVRLTDERESNIRESLHALQNRPLILSPASVPAAIPLAVRAFSALEAIFPPDRHGIFVAFRLFFTAESVRVWTSSIAAAQSTGITDGGFSQLAKVIEETSSRAVAWCFDSPEDISKRSAMLQKGMANLEERVEALSRELSEGESHRWTAEYARMKQDLVAMPIEVIKSIVPASWSRVLETGKIDFDEICQEQARHMKDILTNDERDIQSKVVEDLKLKLNATRLTLEQRNKELEDLRVRVSVFDDKFETVIKDKKTIAELECILKTMEIELVKAKAASEQSAVVENVNEAESINSEKEEESKAAVMSAKQMSHRELAERLNETTRLRRILVQSQLADLHTTASLTKDAEGQLRESMQLRDAASAALNNARMAASTARVVQLDPQTLKPKIEGTTMSRKTLLQSLSTLAKPTGAEQLRRNVARFATVREAKLRNEAEMITTLMTIMREPN